MKSNKITNKNIGNTNYTIEVLDPTNDALRESFNQLFRKTFKFDFEDWYQAGYWTDDYQPHVIVENNKVIANVSVYLMKMRWEGEEHLLAQIGGVATVKNRRHQGLSRILMEGVIEKFRPLCEQIFLFCHKGVVEFYPRFGFIPSEEYDFTRIVDGKKIRQNDTENVKIEHWSLTDQNKVQCLLEKATRGNPFSAFSMTNSSNLLMFYLTKFYTKIVYFIEAFDVIILAEYEGKVLVISEILGETNATLEQIVDAMARKSTKQVQLCFTPKKNHLYQETRLIEKGSYFYILNPSSDVTAKKHYRFPVLSRT